MIFYSLLYFLLGFVSCVASAPQPSAGTSKPVISTQYVTVTKISTQTSIRTTTAILTVTTTAYSSTSALPTTVTTTITTGVSSCIRTTTLYSTATITSCGTVTPTPEVACTRTLTFDQLTITEAGKPYPAVPTGDPSLHGIGFPGFVVYDTHNIPTPPSGLRSVAISNWDAAAIVAETTPFTPLSFYAFCRPEPECTVTLHASSIDSNGAQQLSGSGSFTITDATAFKLVTIDAQGLDGFSGSFAGISTIHITAANSAGERPEMVWFDNFVFSKPGNCTA